MVQRVPSHSSMVSSPCHSRAEAACHRRISWRAPPGAGVTHLDAQLLRVGDGDGIGGDERPAPALEGDPRGLRPRGIRLHGRVGLDEQLDRPAVGGVIFGHRLRRAARHLEVGVGRREGEGRKGRQAEHDEDDQQGGDADEDASRLAPSAHLPPSFHSIPPSRGGLIPPRAQAVKLFENAVRRPADGDFRLPQAARPAGQGPAALRPVDQDV